MAISLAPAALERVRGYLAADPSALGDEAAAWGSYYAHEPVVLAGEVQPALRRLAREAGDAP